MPAKAGIQYDLLQPTYPVLGLDPCLRRGDRVTSLLKT